MIIFNSNGLLGDALSTLPAIWAAAQQEDVYLFSENKAVAELLPLHPKIHHVNDIWQVPNLIDQKKYTLDAGRNMALHCCAGLHMTQGHFRFLELAVPADVPTLDVHLHGDMDDYDFLISPYSRSDDKNNKLIPLDRWQTVIDWLIEKKYEVAVLSSGRDDEAEFKNVENIRGMNLHLVGNYIAGIKKGVLSIDNGIAHYARLLNAPHLQFYPACLPLTWVRNTNNNALVVQDNPLNFTAEKMIHHIQEFLAR